MATMDDRVAADYVFPPVLGAVAWLAGRMIRARTRLAAELHEAAAQLAEARRPSSSSPPPTSAAGSRARCTTWSRTR